MSLSTSPTFYSAAGTTVDSPAGTLVGTVLPTVAAVGTALVGGVFFAFSAFVMPALGRLTAPEGAAAMQSINVTAERAPLMLALFGTALVCLVAGWRAIASWGTAAAPWLLAGAALYLVGTVGVTIVGNVPMNEKLAGMDPSAATTATYWATYLSSWTTWNTVRTVAGLAGSVCFVLARRA